MQRLLHPLIHCTPPNALRKYLARDTAVIQSFRALSARSMSGKPMVNLTYQEVTTKNQHTGQEHGFRIARVSMNRPPANSLNKTMIDEMKAAISEIERESVSPSRKDQKHCSAMILDSTLSNIYCAGLDLEVLHDPSSKEEPGELWTSLQDLWLTLYGTPVATVAAVAGHAPAGGALLAAACDHRLMAGDRPGITIGLNETRFGIIVPTFFIDTFVNVMGQGAAERALVLGALLAPAQALRLGLVDQVVPAAELGAEALKVAAAYSEADPVARGLTKRALRRPALDRLRARRDADREEFVEFIMHPRVQAGLGAYLAGLKKKATAGKRAKL
mmetsp:Transcript_4064/g.6930  ORF Transcript_4064/g.6930 Transcript_4064/m.6930 type:complete len:331 (-) Transcript_4064:312-1304(-)